MLVLRSARLFDGEHFSLGPAAVVVQDGTIVGVEAGRPDPPADAEVVDLGDVTMLPGLVDTHVHLVGDSGWGALDRVAGYSSEELSPVVEESLRRHLAAGCARVDAQQRRLPGRGRATGQQALAAATSLAADACAVGDRRGRLRPGTTPTSSPSAAVSLVTRAGSRT